MTDREMELQKKKELQSKEEKTTTVRQFQPETDIYENDDALIVFMEMPGVGRDNISATVENDVLRVEGRIDFAKYEGLEPVYAEYNVGHYVRAFSLSNKIAQDGISAELSNGVLKLTLKKTGAAKPRQIPIN